MLPRQACCTGTPVRDLWVEKVSARATAGTRHFAFDPHSWLFSGKKEMRLPGQLCHSPTSLAAEQLLSRLPLSIQVFFLQPDQEWRRNLITSGSLPWSGNDRAVESSILGLWDQGRKDKDTRDKGSFHAAWTHTAWNHVSYADKFAARDHSEPSHCIHTGES